MRGGARERLSKPFSQLELHLDKVVRRPGSAIIEREVVIEQPGGFEYAGFEFRLRVATYETGKVHYLSFIPALVDLELEAMPGQDLFDRIGVGFPILIEHAIEQPPDFDFVVMRGLAMGAMKHIAGILQLLVSIDKILEDIGHAQGHAQSHFHFAGHPFQLGCELLMVAGKNLSNGVAVICDDSEGHREWGGFFHEPHKNFLVNGEVPPFRPDPLIGYIADDRSHVAFHDGANFASFETKRAEAAFF